MSAGSAETLGQSVPPFTPHAISVSLPTWRDNVGYEEGEKRVVDAMVTGYPRFFIHKSIQKLASICEEKFGRENEKSLLFPSRKSAEHCRAFMIRQSTSDLPVRCVQYSSQGPQAAQRNGTAAGSAPSTNGLELHIAFFPSDSFPLAKQFWQHTGLGVSSRYAEKILASIAPTSPSVAPSPAPRNTMPLKQRFSRFYLTKESSPANLQVQLSPPHTPPAPAEDEELSADQSTYLEERYGRNLPQCSAAQAKRALRRRIAGILLGDSTSSPLSRSETSSPVPVPVPEPFPTDADDVALGPSARGIETLTEDDVFLYPSGMTAIWSAHQLAMKVLPLAKSLSFGFPYTDTLKILQKWGPGCHFLGHGLDSDIENLTELLEASIRAAPSSPPLLALFCEFPSNPLLRSPNIPRLRALADKYNFLIVIDETVGNFLNVSVLPFADIVVSSLTKSFSGDANVMGGSLVLNPQGRYYASLKATLQSTFEDTFFGEDAIFMERNSRAFKRRTKTINANTEATCDFLRSRSLMDAHAESTDGLRVIKEVFYPKYTTRSNYDLCRNAGILPSESNFGGLFSVTFVSKAASVAFFNALSCYKGPSLGTSFTLACPYTLLAHYHELDWAKGYGVEEGLVRVSVGTEEGATLLAWFEVAVKAAEDAVRAQGGN